MTQLDAMYDPILFDLDGTLTDPGIGIIRSVQHAALKLGLPKLPEGQLRDFIGPPLLESFRLHFGLNQESAADAVEHYRSYFSETGIFENTVYPGILELLASLSTGRRLMVATSKPTVFAWRIVRHFELAEFFHDVIGSELDGTRSAKSEVVSAALATSEQSATNAVMIGDRRHDIEGARANGIASIGVAWGYGPVEELKAARPDATVESPAELHQLLMS